MLTYTYRCICTHKTYTHVYKYTAFSYIYYYLIIILLSNDSSKLPFVSYGYILKTAVAQVHTAPIQTQRGRTQAGMAGLTPACVKSQNQRLAELSLSHHPAHSVCWLQRSVVRAGAVPPFSALLFSFYFHASFQIKAKGQVALRCCHCICDIGLDAAEFW